MMYFDDIYDNFAPREPEPEPTAWQMRRYRLGWFFRVTVRYEWPRDIAMRIANRLPLAIRYWCVQWAFAQAWNRSGKIAGDLNFEDVHNAMPQHADRDWRQP